MAHTWASDVFTEDPSAADQLRLTFGLLHLLDDYWATCEIRFANERPEGPLSADVLWDGYALPQPRRRGRYGSLSPLS
ncbi:hypothetical protein [Streptomyces sp. NPDC002853]